MRGQHATDAPAVRVIPPLFPLLTILAGIGLNRLWPLDIGVVLPAPARYWVGGIIVAGAILGLGAWPIFLFRRSGQSEIPWTPSTRIVERGPYRVTRNPMYLQMVLVCIGVSILLMNVWIVALTPVCAWLLQRFAIVPEEAYLERTFGDAYRAYKGRVRRWI
jgi:protein-S-isoprenylcysteine O-methyltransferase Ste14